MEEQESVQKFFDMMSDETDLAHPLFDQLSNDEGGNHEQN